LGKSQRPQDRGSRLGEHEGQHPESGDRQQREEQRGEEMNHDPVLPGRSVPGGYVVAQKPFWPLLVPYVLHLFFRQVPEAG